ncbi:MAG: hypothetical protein HC921_20415 [Synechococcaceae cyanobacterium SM2_3_1]|nr:hypothetical protein [Synechococcaceae cyanobacterium SM2_3_1]
MTCKTCGGAGWIRLEEEPYLSGYILVDEEVQVNNLGTSYQEDYPSGYVIQSQEDASLQPCPDCLQQARCPECGHLVLRSTEGRSYCSACEWEEEVSSSIGDHAEIIESVVNPI